MSEAQDAPWKVYLDEPAPADPVARFRRHVEECRAFFDRVPPEKTFYRYAPEKWSIRQLLGHVTDADVVFLYRLVCIARGETVSLPAFDENAYAANGGFQEARWDDMLRAHRGICEAAEALVAGLSARAWALRGTANNLTITPLQMLQVWMGHERHHIRALKERYGVS